MLACSLPHTRSVSPTLAVSYTRSLFFAHSLSQSDSRTLPCSLPLAPDPSLSLNHTCILSRLIFISLTRALHTQTAWFSRRLSMPALCEEVLSPSLLISRVDTLSYTFASSLTLPCSLARRYTLDQATMFGQSRALSLILSIVVPCSPSAPRSLTPTFAHVLTFAHHRPCTQTHADVI